MLPKESDFLCSTPIRNALLICMIVFSSPGAKSNWGLKVRRARIRIRKMCKTQLWFWTVLTMVAMNTVSVMVEHYNQPQWLTDTLCKLSFTLVGWVIETLPRFFILK